MTDRDCSYQYDDIKDAEKLRIEELRIGVQRNYAVASCIPEELVNMGRKYYCEAQTPCYSKWPDALASALLRAGYIRTDINNRTFLVGKFYKEIYRLQDRSTDGIYCAYDELDNNAQYKSCQIVSDDWFYEFLEYLADHLGYQEYLIVRLRFGFQDGITWRYQQIGDLFDLPAREIRRIINRALHIISKRNDLPGLVVPPPFP